ncbi:MAG: hypothetical protein J0M11_07950 [Anaerolineae bacterium]|nr:hypothetical protein [Anaerolineae bacterium]
MFDKDPLWLILYRRLHINSFTKSLLFSFGIGAITFIIIPYFSGYLLPRTGILNSLSDWPGFVITFFTHPAIYVFYLYQQEIIFLRLQQELNKSQSEGNNPFSENYIRAATNSKLTPIIALFLTSIGYFLHIQAVLSHPTFSYYYPNKFILYFINAPTSSLAGYMVCLIGIRYLSVTVSLMRLAIKQPLNVNIYHQDKRGGLAFLGKYIFESFILVSIMAVDLSLLFVINLYQTYRNPFTEPSFMSFIFIYTILLPAGFILPLLIFRNSINSRIRLIIHGLDKVGDFEKGIDFEINKPYLNKINSEAINKIQNLHTMPIDNSTLLKFTILFLFSVSPIGLLLYYYLN